MSMIEHLKQQFARVEEANKKLADSAKQKLANLSEDDAATLLAILAERKAAGKAVG